jgi:Transposase IS66 family
MQILKLPEAPLIHSIQHNDIVDRLLEIVAIHEHNSKEYRKEIERLKRIVAELQNAPRKPIFSPSRHSKKKKERKKRREKREESKTSRLPIHEEKVIKPKTVPKGAIFKGYQKYFIQDIQFKVQNILFKLERWQTKDGTYRTATLPKEYLGYHFGPTLRTFITYQYHHARVSRPRLLEQLRDLGIEISKTELNKIILSQSKTAEEEMRAILKTAMKNSPYIQTDDTGARDQGKNKICTQVGNLFFTFLKTTESKSRINFLEILNTPGTYQLNQKAIEYLRRYGSKKLIEQVEKLNTECLSNKAFFNKYLAQEKIEGENNRRLVTEAALIGAITETVKKNIIIISDGAKQFAVMDHAACWVHAIRLLEEENSAIPAIQNKIDEVLRRIWFLYHHLKRYNAHPSESLKIRLDHQFDLICELMTPSPSFNEALKRFQLNKIDLLRCLESPGIPLHNNLSESDLREYVVRRKVSGGTRSDRGRKARDAFCSLVKTCKKLDISFWAWLRCKVYGWKAKPIAKILEERTRLFSMNYGLPCRA